LHDSCVKLRKYLRTNFPSRAGSGCGSRTVRTANVCGEAEA
jgi:hypothetical protein